MTARAAVVTGGAGYLGRLVALRYLEDTDLDVVLHVRAAGPDELAGRVASLGPAFAPHRSRVLPVGGDLGSVDPFAAVDEGLRSRVVHVVHAGALTRFDVEQGQAEQVNVGGTAKAMALARRCPKLESFGLVSTVYASGLRSGPVAEEPCDDQAGFANWYEWSKWRAERLLVDDGSDLPWRILRVATVVADDDGGRVTQLNAFHETLKLWFHGLLSLLPGDGGAPLYFVTGDFAARAIVRLVQGDAEGVYHLAPAGVESPTLAQVLDLVAERFEADEEFRKRRVLRPLLADEESFAVLVDGVTGFGGSLVRQALANVLPFARQLYVRKDLDNARLRAAVDGGGPPAAADIVRGACDWLVATRWGRRGGAGR